MRKTFLICLSLFFFIATNAVTIEGIVLNGQQPLPYASIYIRNNPENGTISNLEGKFSLNIDEKADALIVSFIGFETALISKENLTANDILIIRLKEQPIMIEEHIVSLKVSKKQQRTNTKNMLFLVKEQMEKDFPSIPRKYHIISDIITYSETNQIITFDEIIGAITEFPPAKKDKKEQIQILPNIWKRYIDNSVEEKIKDLNDNVLNKREKAFLEKNDTTTNIHKILWGNSPKQMLYDLAKSPNKWNISRENNDISVLTHTHSKNFFGIIKLILTTNFIVDAHTYSVQKISQNAVINIKIPFGYKLSKDELAVLNVINLGGKDFEKFKVKNATINMKRNMIYRKEGTDSVLEEKNFISNTDIEDSNGNKFRIKNTATIKILKEEKENVRPFSASELSKKASRQFISLDETK